MPDRSLSPEVTALLPQLGQQPQTVVDQLKQLADAGDRDATLLVAWALPAAGRWQEGLPYAERAAEEGAGMAVINYVGQLFSMPDQRQTALRLLRVGLDAGWGADPLGWVQALAQRGDAEGVAELLDVARTLVPRPRTAEFDELLSSLRSARARLSSELAEVGTAKDEIIAAMREHEQATAQEQQRLADLGHKVEIIAHEAASEELSRQYEKQAKRAERSAFWFTVAAIVFGAGAAALAAYFALKHIAQTPDVAQAIGKIAIAVPIALFAAYLGRLAGRYRSIAWRWRHVELQLRTAEAYISELDAARRATLIEALALRFFPGQSLDVDRVGGGTETSRSDSDVVETLSALLRAYTESRAP